MANFWFFFIAAVLFFIVGALITALILFIHNAVMKWSLNKKAELVKKYLKDPKSLSEKDQEKVKKEIMYDPKSTSEKDIREVNEFERQQDSEFREYEKLRRAKRKRVAGSPGKSMATERASKASKRKLLQAESGDSDAGNRGSDEGDEQDLELHKPADL